jgi:hypothetical protein
VKDETRNFVTEQTRVSLLHIIDTSRLLRVLNKDRTALFTAANKASVAATFLSDFSVRRA